MQFDSTIAAVGVSRLGRTLAGSPPVGANAQRDYLAFNLGSQEYAVEFRHVRGVRRTHRAFEAATAAGFIRGTMKLSGADVPIVDLRLKFGLEQGVRDSLTAVVVIAVGSRLVGLLVDGVAGLISISPTQLRPGCEFNAAVESDKIIGVAETVSRRLVLLEATKLMSETELGLFDRTLQ
jgi:purine-binding chemotaxis protein CheW